MKRLHLLILPLALLLLSACATIETVLTKDTLAAQLVVQEATARAIEVGSTPAARYQRAQRIAQTVAAIKVTFDTTATTLPGLVQLATERIVALKLGPSDAIIAQALLDALAERVAAKLCPGADPAAPCTIPADKTIYVDTVLNWVTQATQLYPPA